MTTPPAAAALPAELQRSPLARAPELLVTFLRFYGTLWHDTLVGADVLELARIRNARVVGCGCRNVRFDVARRAGLREETLFATIAVALGQVPDDMPVTEVPVPSLRG